MDKETKEVTALGLGERLDGKLEERKHPGWRRTCRLGAVGSVRAFLR